MLFRGTASGEFVLDTVALPSPEIFAELNRWQPRGFSAADFDGDGDADLIFGTASVGTRMWRNDGDRFVDITDGSGLSSEALVAFSLPVGDIDGDGDLDLFVGHDGDGVEPPDPGGLNGLYLNRGDGTFEDISETLSEELRDGYTQVSALLDFDQDGDVDLYITNHHATYRQNYLLLNDGAGGLVNTPNAGFDFGIESMGIGIGDLNGDGLPDILISGWAGFALLESLGSGLWARTEQLREIFPIRNIDQEVAWANVLADLDNDGDLDAIAGFAPAQRKLATDTVSNPEDQPDGLWIWTDGVFVEEAADWKLQTSRPTRGMVVWDYNGDGWLDVLKTASDKRARLWTANCGEASWLAVDLAQPAPNTGAIGARVVIEAGENTWTRWVTGASTSYVSSQPLRMHFGLGDVETLDRLTVYWPDGRHNSFSDIPARQRVGVTRTDL
jgi:hypothetical protein